DEKKRLHGFSLNTAGIKEANMSQLLGSKLKKAIPRYVDYRKTVSKTPVRTQEIKCYIFAALSTFEMHIALKNRKPPVRLSVQDVMDCSSFQKCYGRGGDLTQVYDWVSENGVMTSEKYPYKENDSKVLAVYGPVGISLHASRYGFISYDRGIYDDPDCPDNTNHAVVAVGYGVKNGKKYFIIGNEFISVMKRW
ncbi:unnamed protein product, partial [Cercopithifilaria johnstoni]